MARFALTRLASLVGILLGLSVMVFLLEQLGHKVTLEPADAA